MRHLLLALLLLTACGEDVDPRVVGRWRVDQAALARDPTIATTPALREAFAAGDNPLLGQLIFEFGPRTFAYASAAGARSGRFEIAKRNGDVSVLVPTTGPRQEMTVTVVEGGLRLEFAGRTLPLVPAVESEK